MNDISYYFVGLATGLIICLISWWFGMAMERQRNEYAKGGIDG